MSGVCITVVGMAPGGRPAASSLLMVDTARDDDKAGVDVCVVSVWFVSAGVCVAADVSFDVVAGSPSPRLGSIGVPLFVDVEGNNTLPAACAVTGAIVAVAKRPRTANTE